MTSAGLVRAKSRRPFAVSTGSPVTNAIAVGPARSFSSMAVTPASRAAMAVRVFLTTAYVACPPMLLRSWVSCDTVRPRYSVRTAALEFRNLSESSATAAALSGLAMALLPPFVVPVAKGPGQSERPGAGARGVRKPTRRVGARAAASRDGSRLFRSTCAGRPLVRDLRPPLRVVTGGLWLTFSLRDVLRPLQIRPLPCSHTQGRGGRNGPRGRAAQALGPRRRGYASTVSSWRLRVLFTSIGMPGPI